MFEREIMISTLKKQHEDLKRLVEEMEQRVHMNWHDKQYYRESLKKIEGTLKRMRHVDDTSENAVGGLKLKYQAYPMAMREMS